MTHRFLHLPEGRLLCMLLERHFHSLAMDLSTSLKWNPDTIIKHWAEASISNKRQDTDEALLTSIQSQCSANQATVDFADLAQHAIERDRPSLALQVHMICINDEYLL